MKTSTKENGLEVKVGLFLCFGLLIIAGMILEFGLGGKQGLFKKYYTLVVDLPDADGLLKNSRVVLGGAQVGYVSTKPVLTSSLDSVRVTINVDNSIKIPVGSSFQVATSGLLGDKYVTIQTGSYFKASDFDPKNPALSYQPVDTTKPVLRIYDPANPAQYDTQHPHPELQYQAGDVIMGETTPGIPEAVKKLSDAIDSVKVMIGDLQNGILSRGNQQNVVDMVATLKDMSANLKKSLDDAGSKLPGIMTGAQGAVDKANQTMTTVRDAADSLKTTLQNARDLMDKASHGDGLVSQLINNRQLADNFSALVVNLRKRGILFYKDTTPAAPPAPTPVPRDRKPR